MDLKKLIKVKKQLKKTKAQPIITLMAFPSQPSAVNYGLLQRVGKRGAQVYRLDQQKMSHSKITFNGFTLSADIKFNCF